jgi:hypothetical protein
VGERVHAVLFVVRLTTPANPLSAVTLMIEVPIEPALTVTFVGVAVVVKSWTTNVTVAEWDSEPLVPVTNTCLLPVDVNVHDIVALPEPVTLVGVTVQDEVVLVTRLTIPAKPFTAVIVVVEVPTALTFTLTLVGLVLIVKS